jgi:hypothetical protein
MIQPKELSIALSNLGVGAICVLLLCILGSLINVNPHNFQDISSVLSSLEFIVGIWNMIIASLPIIFDLIFDSFIINKCKSRRQYYDYFGRLIFSMGLLVIGIQLPGKYNSFFNSQSKFLVLMYCLEVTSTSSLMFCLSLAKPSIFCSYITIGATSLVSVNTIIRLFLFRADLFICGGLSLCLISLVTILVSFSYIFYKNFWIKRNSWITEDYAALLYLSVYLIILIGSYVAPIELLLCADSSCISFDGQSTIHLMFNIYCYVLGTVMLIIIPGRIARMNAVALKVAITSVIVVIIILSFYNNNFPFFRIMNKISNNLTFVSFPTNYELLLTASS